MPIVNTTEYLKLTFGGSAWDGQEIWSIGVHLAMVDGSSVETALADFDLNAAIGAWIGNMNVAGVPSQGAAVKFEEVRLARFTAQNAGGQVGDSRVAFNSVNVDGLDFDPYIPQHSIVVTLNSDLLRGKTSKGRFYLPPGYGTPDGNGYIPESVIQSTADQVFGFLNDLADVASSADPDLRIVNFSPRTLDTSAISNAVTYFTIGNVVDTQRRRRNGLQERYTRSSLIA